MQLTFLGTKAKTDPLCDHHALHSALLVTAAKTRLLIDCGRDWLGRWEGFKPDALLLTHAHADHVGGLGRDLPCPIYASADCRKKLTIQTPPPEILVPDQALRIGAITLLPFAVAHSRRAPTIGLRIAAQGRSCIYCPDVADIEHPEQQLAGVDLYIGDGSCYHRDLRRTERGQTCGHAPIPQQLGWCAQAQLGKALFTHCGEEVVAREAILSEELQQLGHKLGLDARFAVDGEIVRV